jgi:hypothetical protein
MPSSRSAIAILSRSAQTEGVGSWGDLSYILGPVLVLFVVGGLALFLRWAFAPGGSLVARPSRRGTETEYGLLASVASPGSYVEGEMLRRRLEAAGVKANLVMTQDGPRVMVFPKDRDRARQVLAGPHRAAG